MLSSGFRNIGYNFIPQVSPDAIQLYIALARYTLLHDIISPLKFSIDWVTLRGVANSSPTATTINNWVKDLAYRQVMIFRDKISDSVLFYQTDGGHQGQEVSLFSFYNTKTDKVEHIWAGLNSVGGKGGDNVAASVKLRLELMCKAGTTIDGGSTMDSGPGTPELHTAACRKLE